MAGWAASKKRKRAPDGEKKRPGPQLKFGQQGPAKASPLIGILILGI